MSQPALVLRVCVCCTCSRRLDRSRGAIDASCRYDGLGRKSRKRNRESSLRPPSTHRLITPPPPSIFTSVIAIRAATATHTRTQSDQSVDRFIQQAIEESPGCRLALGVAGL